MRITPLDIRKQEFSRRMRGDDPEEVQAFLKVVAEQWEEAMEEQRRLESRLHDQERKLQHYERVEEALQEALRTARQSARQAEEVAERKAAQIIREAEGRAEEIKREAEGDRLRIKRETTKLESRRNEVVARLRAFLMSELELLAHFEGSDPVGFIKLLPSKGRVGADFRLPPAEAAEAEGDVPPTSDAGSEEDVEPGRRGASGEGGGGGGSSAEGRGAKPAFAGEPKQSEDRADAPAEAPGDRTEPVVGRTSETAGGAAPTSGPARSGRGWVNRPIISAPPTYGGPRPNHDAPSKGEAAEDPARSGEEIEKIRRILRELD